MKHEDIASQFLELLPQLWAFAWRISGNEHEAEHVVGQSFRCAFEFPAELLRGPFKMRMFALIYRIWIHGRDKREPMREPGDALIENADDRAHRTVVNALGRLPDEQRISMLLVAVEGFSYADTAFILGVPVRTLIAQLAEARLGRFQS